MRFQLVDLRKTFSIALALIMLVSNIGITFTSHFCGGKTVKAILSIGLHEIECGMTQTQDFCQKSNEPSSICHNNCCENRFQHISIQDEYETLAFETRREHQKFWTSSYGVEKQNINQSSVNQRTYLNYSPPLLIRDIPLEIQKFTI